MGRRRPSVRPHRRSPRPRSVPPARRHPLHSHPPPMRPHRPCSAPWSRPFHPSRSRSRTTKAAEQDGPRHARKQPRQPRNAKLGQHGPELSARWRLGHPTPRPPFGARLSLLRQILAMTDHDLGHCHPFGHSRYGEAAGVARSPGLAATLSRPRGRTNKIRLSGQVVRASALFR